MAPSTLTVELEASLVCIMTSSSISGGKEDIAKLSISFAYLFKKGLFKTLFAIDTCVISSSV
ncbi:ORF1151 [White spot syndrome virus]|uniref:ORF1151 n=1 Tax=White spot syndrome virus TaxID=342409 RepID=A0A2D3I778_9VIRU|nr:ORF1151 [White spot syndrome virus]